VAPIQRWKVAWPDRVYGPWDIELQFGPVGRRFELVGMVLKRKPADLTEDEPDDGEPLTTALLRSLPLARLTAQWRAELSQMNRDAVATKLVKVTGFDGKPLDDAAAIALLDSLSGLNEERVGRPVFWTDQRLAELAAVYDEAWTAGQNPTAAVAKHFHKSHSMAAKLVSMARQRGRLPQTTPGKAGGGLPRAGRYEKS
jgi:hypothetical protein